MFAIAFITFKLNDIQPADVKLKAKQIDVRSIFKDFSTNIEFVSSTKAKGFPIYGNINGLLHTLTLCYAKHYSLELMPDDIMFVIIDGLSIHIEQNAEQLREFFSNQQKKHVIHLNRDDFVKGDQNDWSKLFADFNIKIKDIILDQNLIELMQQK